jgi:hypothetical protein
MNLTYTQIVEGKEYTVYLNDSNTVDGSLDLLVKDDKWKYITDDLVLTIIKSHVEGMYGQVNYTTKRV